MSSTSDLLSILRTLPGAHNFSPELRRLVAESHAENGKCFLCNGFFHSNGNGTAVEVRDAVWSQVFRFMKKLKIPPCLIGLGIHVAPVFGKEHQNQIRELMNLRGFKSLSKTQYASVDVERVLLDIFVCSGLDFRYEFAPDFSCQQNCMVKNFQLEKWPEEICAQVHYQAFVLKIFFEFESQICNYSKQSNQHKIYKDEGMGKVLNYFHANRKMIRKEKAAARERNFSDEKIEEIVKNIGTIKGAKKQVRKTTEKKSTNQKPRIVRTKFNKAARPQRSQEDDTTSLEGNKFHKRFRKTKRNVRV